jgi:hypothetical protein
MNNEPLASLLPRELAEMRCRSLFAFHIDVKPPHVVGQLPATTGASAKSPAAVSKASVCAARSCRAAAIGSRSVMTGRLRSMSAWSWKPMMAP